MREAVRNRTSSASPARNGNKSHKLGTSFQKVSSKRLVSYIESASLDGESGDHNFTKDSA